MTKKLNVISIFSGAGGLDFGFESSGFFESIACVESNKDHSQG